MYSRKKNSKQTRWFLLGAAIVAGTGWTLPARAQTLEEALDNPAGITFSTRTFDFGTGQPIPGIEWFGQTVTTHDTTDAAEVSGLPKNSRSSLDATIQGPGTLTFWWKVDTNNPIETLRFASSAGHFFGITDEVDWQIKTAQFGCGEHNVSWYLDINEFSSGADGDNAAWLDEVVFTPTPNVPELATALDIQNVEFYSSDWSEQSDVNALNGTLAKSGYVDSGSSSKMEFQVEGPFEISFDWGIEKNSSETETKLVFRVDGDESASIGDSGGSMPLENLAREYGPGLHCFSITFQRGFDDDTTGSEYDGLSEGFVDNLQITPIPMSLALANAVDRPTPTFEKNVYSASWIGQNQVTHDDDDAACVSGLAPDGSESMMVELPDDVGLLTLWVKLSAEDQYGYLDVFVDGGYIDFYTGEQDWTKVEAYLPAGANRVLWLVYSRFGTGGGDLGDNAAYVDEIEFTIGATPPEPPEPPAPPPPPEPVFQPDMTIKAPGSSSMGGNKYNKNGRRQTASHNATLRKPFGKFKMSCQNDSPTELDRMVFYGTKANKNFDVIYIIKQDGELFNISAEFQTGQFSTATLEALEAAPFQVWIARKEGRRKRKQSVRVRAVSLSDSTKTDTVKAVVEVERLRRR